MGDMLAAVWAGAVLLAMGELYHGWYG
jgi:hypothetical protein